MMQGPAYYIVLMYLAGIVMGTIFDIYNTVTSATNWLRIVRSVLDIGFFVAFALVVYHISLVTDNGRFRLYTFGLILIGYVVYRMFFHHAIVASAHVIIHILKVVLLAVWKLAYVMLINPLLWTSRILRSLLGILYRIGCRIEDIVCKCAAFIFRVLLFPFRGYTRIFLKVKMKVQPIEEGIWIRLSKWLKRYPRGA